MVDIESIIDLPNEETTGQRPKVYIMTTVNIKTDVPCGHMSELAQGIIAELTLGARLAVNIRGMLDDQDFDQIELAAFELADEFGNSSDPIKRLRAKLDDYGKIKGNKRYTVKTLSGTWKVVVKAAKKVDKSQVVRSTSNFIKQIGEMAESAKLTKQDRERMVKDLELELGLITTAAHKKAA